MKGKLVTIGVGSVIDGNGTVRPEINEKVLDHTPELEELQAAIGGGPIEPVPYFNRYDGQDCVAFVDEEGKNKGMPYNHAATALWEAQPQLRGYGGLRGLDWLVGPVGVGCGDHELLRDL